MSAWAWWGVYGGCCDGSGYGGQCWEFDTESRAAERLTGNVVCVKFGYCEPEVTELPEGDY